MYYSMKKSIFFALLLIISSFAAYAAKKPASPKGYRFSFTVKGSSDTVMYLGYYYAGNSYVVDTTKINKKGQFVFENKDVTLKPGMYFFTNPGGNYVEFAVYNETPNFVFETKEGSWAQHMTVKGSKQNELFYTYHRLNRHFYDIIDSAAKSKTDEEAFKAFRTAQLRALDSIKMDIIHSHPDYMIAKMMNATRDIPVPLQDSTGRDLSQRERWEYYMEHYWDYSPLDDDFLIRTPEAIFHRRFTDYLDKNLRGAAPDIIIRYVDMTIEKSRPSKEMFKYIVHTITEKYLQSPVMSYDEIYVHLVNKYFATGDNFWSSPSVIDEQIKRAATWEKILIGKVAPNIILKDTLGMIHSLHESNHRYTLLIFWSPSCGHCKTVIPELYKKYQQYRSVYDIDAFAVLSEPDDATRPLWKQFIKEHHLDWKNLDGGECNIDWHEVYDVITTPQIFLLDKDHKIIAKKLNAETFEKVLEAYAGNQ